MMTYVFFDPDFEGPNNLRLSLTFALTLARLLNRTLVLPPLRRRRRGADAAGGAARARRGERRAEAAAAVAHEPRRQPEAERGELGGAARAEGREVSF